MKKKNFMVTIKSEATYIIRAAKEEDAIYYAEEWFDEREPDITVEITDEEPETVINDDGDLVDDEYDD